ncbi:glutaminyl-peptide cyclotransferase [Arachidicoccus ginsenosidivorans]|uniref:Glutaminyl-peptide cyclotransferase n=1 Tax=Arachidicoccus ginsenosidivorans TaxID=496057 RepID=A0A5B8VPP6_9BACT|nr:glutaminyl-peptide cyclotransferase [Arachidicoccus ginsenosidivorans]QEC73419.1 glutaminyl-peptide cyclotransferase [Arachidicoccus ginsenosidivorans]
MLVKKYMVLPLFILAVACGNSAGDHLGNQTDQSTTLNAKPDYTVIKVYPHDPSAFTEGFYLKGDTAYESAGEPEKSRLFSYDLNSGKVYQEVKLAKADFGEGISELGGKIYQMTWQQHIVYVYDAKTLKKTGQLTWPNEGWGMTTDEQHLIVSDGSSHLYYINPVDFSVVKTLNIQGAYGPLSQINELEYVDGFIYANVWQTDNIVKIDPATSKVVATYDLTDIRKKNGFAQNKDDVLNGIAYHKATGNFVITGKNWQHSFEIKFANQPKP